MNSKLGLLGTFHWEDDHNICVYFHSTLYQSTHTDHTFVFCSIGTILYDGRPDDRKALREKNFGQRQFNVLLTHYDLILKDLKFLKKVHWHYLIVDEGHRLKNHECALARTLVSRYRFCS